jgi:hypothetical protein
MGKGTYNNTLNSTTRPTGPARDAWLAPMKTTYTQRVQYNEGNKGNKGAVLSVYSNICEAK